MSYTPARARPSSVNWSCVYLQGQESSAPWGRLFQVFLTPNVNFLHSDCVHHILFCPSTPARRATWIMRPLSYIFTSKRLNNPNFHCLSPMLQPQPSCGVSWCLSYTWKPKTGQDPSDVITQLMEKEELLFWLLFYWIICPIYPFKTCIAVPKYPKIFFALRCKLIYDKKMGHENNI